MYSRLRTFKKGMIVITYRAKRGHVNQSLICTFSFSSIWDPMQRIGNAIISLQSLKQEGCSLQISYSIFTGHIMKDESDPVLVTTSPIFGFCYTSHCTLNRRIAHRSPTRTNALYQISKLFCFRLDEIPISSLSHCRSWMVRTPTI